MAAFVRSPHVLKNSFKELSRNVLRLTPNTPLIARSLATSVRAGICRPSTSYSGRNITFNVGIFKVKPRAALTGVWLVRKKSDVAGGSAKDLVPGGVETGYLPDPPPIQAPSGAEETATENVVQALNALGEPTLASLGFCNYTPVGAVQTGMEFLHATCNLPWWGTIMAGTICIRFLVFPLVVVAQRNAAKLQNHGPTIQVLQEKFTVARKSANPMSAARAAQELSEYMKTNNVSYARSMLVPMCQVPIFLSVFLSIRQLANLPVESLTSGGMLWFVDLTISDPYLALPLLTSATLLTTIEVGTDGVKAGSMTQNMKLFMRALPIVMFPVIMNFPTAMLCYWLSTNVFSLCQVLFLRIPKVRKFFNIEPLVKHSKVATFTPKKKKKFFDGLKEGWDNSRLTADIENRQRHDALKFKEAGSGPLKKTYRHNPKAAKAKVAARAK